MTLNIDFLPLHACTHVYIPHTPRDQDNYYNIKNNTPSLYTQGTVMRKLFAIRLHAFETYDII